tara:strand:+ start:55 stop:1884 length:1830 start_codon:yes stop_codon:yes gene_type:complete
MPGQGLEGALEILEATNQLYYVRAAGTNKTSASGLVALGACPAVQLSGAAWDASLPSSIFYSVSDNGGNFKISGTVAIPASSTTYPTKKSLLYNAFDPTILGDQPVFAYVDTTGNQFLASKYAGSGAALVVSAVGYTNATLSFAQTVDVSGNGSTTSGAGVHAAGFQASSLQLLAEAIYPGTGYNLSGLRDGSIQGVSVEIVSRSIEDTISVNSEGAQVEQFNVVLSPSAANSVEYLLINDPLNNNSDYVYTDVLNADTAYTGVPDQFGEKLSVGTGFNGELYLGTATPRFVKMVEGTYSLAGGHSGYATTSEDGSDDKTALIGTATAKTGLYALDDDSLNISIATIPGISDQDVQNALITLGETSKNFLALLAPPYAVGNTQAAVDWLNGKSGRTAAVNSSYAAAYWPWVQVFNSFAGAEEWYDPAIFAARQCVFTDSISEPWFAPAGFRRGRLTKPSDTEIALNQGDKDTLYSNAVNPITKEPQTGITIFGQKTTQRLPTALDRVNVRRLMIFIRKTLLQLGKPFQFEPNDVFTWEKVEEAINPFLSDLKARRAIIEGAVQCDSSTNTSLRVDRNELWCSVTIKPTKAAETIVFEVNLTSQSATING